MHGESQVLIENHQRLSADRKSGTRIARSCLIERKPAQGRATASEESLWKRDIAGDGPAVRRLHAKTGRSRKHQTPADWAVGGILQKHSKEIDRRTDGFHRYGQVDIFEVATRSVGGIVAPIPEPARSKFRDIRILIEERKLLRSEGAYVEDCIYFAISITVQE